MPKKKTHGGPRTIKEQNGRLHFKLAQSIGEQILSGVYAPGALLPNEAEWCQIHGASRTAVREAIKGLNAKGLLVSRPKIGSRVEPRDRWNMLDRDVLSWYFAVADKRKLLGSIQEIRKVVEPEAAALAAAKRTPAQLRILQNAFSDMCRADGPGAAVEPDVRFHLAVLAAANNELLAPFGVLIESALMNLFDYTTHRRYDPKLVNPLHRKILASIENSDPVASRKAVRVLLEDTDTILSSGARKGRRRPIGPASVKQR